MELSDRMVPAVPYVVFSVGVASFALLYYRKVRKPLQFLLMRFGMNMLLILSSALSLYALPLLVDATLPAFLGKWDTVPRMVLWAIIFAAVAVKCQIPHQILEMREIRSGSSDEIVFDPDLVNDHVG